MRISLFGGGTDLPAYSSKFEGRVISFTIDKYISLVLNKKFETGFRLSYSQTENPTSVSKIKHKIFREVLSEFEISDGLEIVSIADIPSKGSGLGSSSSFTVSLINVLVTHLNLNFSKEQIAELAFRIEYRINNGAIGRQDQYAAAVGGINSIIFHKDSSVQIDPIKISRRKLISIQSSMLLFYTNRTRKASTLLTKQAELTSTSKDTQYNLHKLKELCQMGLASMENGNLEEVGSFLGDSWELKKSIQNGITNNSIEKKYTKAINAGAWGGKLLGAGGGGFFLFLAPTTAHEKIVSELSGWRRVEFNLDFSGTSSLEIG